MKPVLVDAGPLVALLRQRDSWHNACVRALRDLRVPLLTSWPVITEAAWLLRREPHLVTQLLRSQDGGGIRVVELGPECLSWVATFLERYADLPADLADATLVYLAEREKVNTIFTLDRKDFSVYRLSGNRRLELVPFLSARKA